MTGDILLQRVTQGDAEALEQLYERHGKALERHVQSMVRDDAAADDLLQEVFLRVWERTAQFSGNGTPRSWLYRIATNLALNHLDAVRRRRQQRLEPVSEENDDGDSPLPAWFVDEAAIAPDVALEQLEQRRLVRGLVDALPESKRRVIHLVYDADLAVSEVAAELGVPEGTIKSRLHHARR
jgi:RNA polymerase sigma-70 factor (ECF subfamily)